MSAKRGGRGWTIIRATWSGITPRYIWLGEKICVAENLKPFISGIGLLNYCFGVAVNEKCDFSWKTDEHYEAWRGSITKIGSNPGLERGLAADPIELFHPARWNFMILSTIWNANRARILLFFFSFLFSFYFFFVCLLSVFVPSFFVFQVKKIPILHFV